MTSRKKLKIKFFAIIILAVVAGLVSYPQAVKKVPRVYDFFNKAKINLGLDLQGGIHLEYKADTSQIDSSKVGPALQALQDVISRRVNAFGVAEPVIYTQKSGSENRLVVELAGVKDINQAKKRIGDMPFLEFKEEKQGEIMIKQISSAHILIKKKNISESDNVDEINKQNEEAKKRAEELLSRALAGEDFSQLAKDNSEDLASKDKGGDLGFARKGQFVPEFDKVLFDPNFKDGTVWPELVESQYGWHIIKKILETEQPEVDYVSTGLTGKNLKNAFVGDKNMGIPEPTVDLQFDDEGTKLFGEITKRNIGKPIAIFLDGEPISIATVNEEISGGKAQISGKFTPDKANDLVKRLNEGALPVPITLVGQQSVEASLGQVSLQKSLYAGLIGLICVIVFMIVYYRFLGLIAALALIIYSVIMISVFKLSAFSPWQITLTLPGIAGFILSIGMAVDANILIFERTKEEIRKGRTILGAIEEGFKRAWTSIRDGNVSSIITAAILIFMGTGFVKGFAITLIIGVLISMFTAVVITRTILRFLMGEWIEDKLWMIGVKKKDA